jgi:hypothetical protein
MVAASIELGTNKAYVQRGTIVLFLFLKHMITSRSTDTMMHPPSMSSGSDPRHARELGVLGNSLQLEICKDGREEET